MANVSPENVWDVLKASLYENLLCVDCVAVALRRRKRAESTTKYSTGSGHHPLRTRGVSCIATRAPQLHQLHGSGVSLSSPVVSELQALRWSELKFEKCTL